MRRGSEDHATASRDQEPGGRVQYFGGLQPNLDRMFVTRLFTVDSPIERRSAMETTSPKNDQVHIFVFKEDRSVRSPDFSLATRCVMEFGEAEDVCHLS